MECLIMADMKLVPVTGIVQNITSMRDNCCELLVSIRNADGITNFVVGPDSYVINEVRLRPGMNVIAFYDANLAIPLIFPPQYRAVIIGRKNPSENMYAGYFDESLTSEDGSLKLNMTRTTDVVTSNGQHFNCDLGGRLLIVYYSASTRSIPAQTTPRRVIVLC